MGYDDPVGPCVYCGSAGAPINGLCVDCSNKADRQAANNQTSELSYLRERVNALEAKLKKRRRKHKSK